MVGRLFPAARVADDVHFARGVAKRRACPDVIEPSAAVRLLPIGGAIAPPGVKLLGSGDETAHDVDPATGLLKGAEFLHLDRRVADDVQELFLAPNIVVAGGGVMITGRE